MILYDSCTHSMGWDGLDVDFRNVTLAAYIVWCPRLIFSVDSAPAVVSTTQAALNAFPCIGLKIEPQSCARLLNAICLHRLAAFERGKSSVR